MNAVSGTRQNRGRFARRRLHWHVALGLWTAMLTAHTTPALANKPQERPGRTVRLQVAQAGWGHTDPQRLQSLLREVVQVFSEQLPGNLTRAIRITPAAAGPMVLVARSEQGEYQMKLSARDGRWYQFAYQFAHEMCHVHANFALRTRDTPNTNNGLQWFEESLCEAVSLHVLNTLARRWSADAGPWSGEAASFMRYVKLLREAPHRKLPQGQSLPQWYAVHADRLSADPYLREQNEIVANRLLDVFENTPNGLAAIAYLGRCGREGPNGVDELLQAWRDACPTRYRALTEQTMRLFGIPSPASGAPANENTRQTDAIADSSAASRQE